MSATPLILIPARRASTRLPEKLLLAATGKALLVHSCEQAALAYGKERVIVCADDQALIDVCQQAGFRAVMTSAHHQSGTDRIAEVAAQEQASCIVNVQGDEPDMDPAHIQAVATLITQHEWAGMATLACPVDASQQLDPNAVKVVLGARGRALYFTRAPAVWDRDAGHVSSQCYRHLGIYAYRKDVLLSYADLPHSPLEHTEKLEQLRALEAGIGIACGLVDQAAPGIDVSSDYDAFVRNYQGASS